MNKQHLPTSDLKFKPVTPARWDDFAKLFGQRGACGGCWCMHWRFHAKEFEQKKGAGNKRAMKKIVMSGKIPGILAYVDKEPVGWCSVAPRDVFVRLERFRILKPIDNKPVWSITCLFIARPYRQQGVSVELLKATLIHVRKKGGKIVEGYPIEPDKKWPDAFAWTGVTSAYLKAGFQEVHRPAPSRPIMRCYLK